VTVGGVTGSFERDIDGWLKKLPHMGQLDPCAAAFSSPMA